MHVKQLSLNLDDMVDRAIWTAECFNFYKLTIGPHHSHQWLASKIVVYNVLLQALRELLQALRMLLQALRMLLQALRMLLAYAATSTAHAATSTAYALRT